MSDLTDIQKEMVAGWVTGGAGISEVQRRINEEFGIKMTYMDVRFLLLDLEVKIKDKPDPKPDQPSAGGSVVGPGTQGLDDAMTGMDGGAVRVSFDKVVQAGAIVSGSATFSDGVSATWMLDQMGRLALNPSTPGYRPSEADVQEFQLALRNELQKMGY